MLKTLIVLACFYVVTWLILRRWKRQDNNQDQVPDPPPDEYYKTPVKDLPDDQKFTVTLPYRGYPKEKKK